LDVEVTATFTASEIERDPPERRANANEFMDISLDHPPEAERAR
jgi:hypothetical protein